MIRNSPSGKTDFDEFSNDYDAALASGLSLSGENKDYFASGRIEWLRHCLGQLDFKPKRIMDFGCGTGSGVPFISDVLGPKFVLGVDVSAASLETARRLWGSDQTGFLLYGQYKPDKKFDLVFCNGVFHHIPIAERAAKVRYVHDALRPGGLFAFWENNPWNPGTRHVMRRIPFDRDAVTLSYPEASRLLRAGGFEVVRGDFLFIFPRILSWFRPIEPLLTKMPLGGQYQILCRKK